MEKELFDNFKFNDHLQIIFLYPAQETENDSYEHTTSKIFLNPIPVKALVKDYKPEALRWKFTGTLPMGSKEIICEKKYKTLFKIAHKIKINDDYFKVYSDDEKGFGIIEREDYIVCILSYKGNNIND